MEEQEHYGEEKVKAINSIQNLESISCINLVNVDKKKRTEHVLLRKMRGLFDTVTFLLLHSHLGTF